MRKDHNTQLVARDVITNVLSYYNNARDLKELSVALQHLSMLSSTVMHQPVTKWLSYLDRLAYDYQDSDAEQLLFTATRHYQRNMSVYSSKQILCSLTRLVRLLDYCFDFGVLDGDHAPRPVTADMFSYILEELVEATSLDMCKSILAGFPSLKEADHDLLGLVAAAIAYCCCSIIEDQVSALLERYPQLTHHELGAESIYQLVQEVEELNILIVGDSSFADLSKGVNEWVKVYITLLNK